MDNHNCSSVNIKILYFATEIKFAFLFHIKVYTLFSVFYYSLFSLPLFLSYIVSTSLLTRRSATLQLLR